MLGRSPALRRLRCAVKFLLIMTIMMGMTHLSRFMRRGFYPLILIAMLPFLVSSCSTMRVARFHESESVNLELRFYRWDSIYMMKPDTRQNGFLPLMNTSQVAQEIRQRKVGHNLAVVIVGYTYDEGQARTIAGQWQQFLLAQGFRRVVALRAGEGTRIDGLPIIADSGMSAPHDWYGNNNSSPAFPSAAGTDVANSPVPKFR